LEITYIYKGKKYKIFLDTWPEEKRNIVKIAFWHGHNAPTIIEYINVTKSQITYETVKNSFDYNYLVQEEKAMLKRELTLRNLKRTLSKKIYPLLSALISVGSVVVKNSNLSPEKLITTINYIFPFDISYKEEDDSIVLFNPYSKKNKRHVVFDWSTGDFINVKIHGKCFSINILDRYDIKDLRTFFSLLMALNNYLHEKKRRVRDYKSLVNKYLNDLKKKITSRDENLIGVAGAMVINRLLNFIDLDMLECFVKNIIL